MTKYTRCQLLFPTEILRLQSISSLVLNRCSNPWEFVLVRECGRNGQSCMHGMAHREKPESSFTVTSVTPVAGSSNRFPKWVNRTTNEVAPMDKDYVQPGHHFSCLAYGTDGEEIYGPKSM